MGLEVYTTPHNAQRKLEERESIFALKVYPALATDGNGFLWKVNGLTQAKKARKNVLGEGSKEEFLM
jgi:hypothetical protein